MNRWAVRLMGILLVLFLLFVLWGMKRTLEQMQDQRSQQHAPR
jgi:steroid 5-alpha reductase family enzyme